MAFKRKGTLRLTQRYAEYFQYQILAAIALPMLWKYSLVMGAYWCSQAEVVTTEPTIVKNLILQIASKKNTTSVHNLEIKGNDKS
jgi:hypothetical protein